MSEKTTKQLIEEVLEKVELTQKITTQLSVSHYELRDVVTDIDNTLRGTQIERESGKGGMAKQVQCNTEGIHDIKKKQNKVYAWGTVLITVLNAALFTVLALFKNSN